LTAQYLLDTHAVKIDAKDFSGSTALHYASYSGLVHVVQILVYYGASPHVKDQEGKTPIKLACEGGHSENRAQVIRILQVRHSSNVRSKGKSSG
jgi:ankyrin repeat protein